jgi:hypothetical protein
MRETALLASATPVGGLTRDELVRAFDAGSPRAPAWTYAPLDSALAASRAVALESLADALATREPPELAQLYAERARELAVETLLAAEAGTPRFSPRARTRFPAGDEVTEASEASRVAREWIGDLAPTPPPDTTTDGSDPFSLLSRLREEIGRHRLPFRVVVAEGLAPLAATGERVVWVTAGRSVAREAVERTVLHEIEGHVLPRVRASTLPLGIFALGTACGTDDQEGFALLLEERGGFLRGGRRRELAIRHRAVEAMDAGGTFVDVVRALIDEAGATTTGAVAAAERAFRGSTGEAAGLGRERVYITSYVRVKGRLATSPEDERVIGSGQVAVSAIDALRAYAEGPEAGTA